MPFNSPLVMFAIDTAQFIPLFSPSQKVWGKCTATLRSWRRGGYINTEDMLVNVPDDDENVITIREARARARITSSRG